MEVFLNIIGVLMACGLGILIYLFPMLHARNIKHKNAASIAVVNVALGWTLVGWVVAMAWAVKKD
jgi:hypothetical protein